MREGPSGKRFDDQWREIPDDTPVSVSVNLRPKSMEQMVALYVAQAMTLQQKMNGEESSAEAEDLDVDEEGDSEILTPYELHALAAEAERDARRKEWLLHQIRGKKKGVDDGKGKGGGAAAPGGAGASPVGAGDVRVEARGSGAGGEGAAGNTAGSAKTDGGAGASAAPNSK